MILRTLNDEQLEVVNSTASKLLVLAGAGTGKTETMIQKTIQLVKNLNVSPSDILVLTFTNAAASEMEERYNKYMKGCKYTSTPFFGTFHSFCYQLICRDINVRRAAGYTNSEPPSIVDDTKLKDIRLECRKKSNCKLSNIQMLNPETLSKSDKFSYDMYMKCFNTEIARQNIITFDMMMRRVSNLFVCDDYSVRRYKSKYKYLFIDEFQDTDETQFNFMKSFKDANMMVVGDALQNLYSFRGTSSKMIKGLSVDHDWKCVRLTRNYRSTIEICKFANDMSTYAEDSYRIPIRAERSGVPVNVCGCTIDDNMIEEIRNMDSSSTAAFLCRTNKEVTIVCDLLSRKQVAYSTKNSEESELNSIIESLKDNSYQYRYLISKMSTEDVCSFIKKHHNEKNIETKLDYLKSENYMSLSRSLELLDKAYTISSMNDITTDQGIADFKNFFSINLETSNVYVGTIHSSKGLEYDIVHVMNVGGKFFELTSEDNMNCYYVALTRAKNKLYVHKA